LRPSRRKTKAPVKAMSADVITKWWPQITALLILVFWISRTISELKGLNETQDERLRQIDKKVEQLFVL
jgi:hypothetical protein